MGKEIIHLKEVDSTNRYLLDMTSKKPVSPWTVVFSEFQINGRGQRLNQWFSSRSKNLLCSLLLKPSFLQPTEQFLINIIASLAMYDVVDEIIQSDRTRIKWPNDIFIDNSKVAGLLIQNSIQGASINHSILGMGINLNEENFPLDLSNACSLKQLTNIIYDPKTILAQLIKNIQKYYVFLESGQFQYLRDQYTSKLFRLHETTHFKDQKGFHFKGIIVGVNDLGQLNVIVNDEIHVFSMKEIEMILTHQQ